MNVIKCLKDYVKKVLKKVKKKVALSPLRGGEVGNFSPVSVRQFGVGISGLIWTIFLNISDNFGPFCVVYGHSGPF